jgi:hypothetical protein
MGRRTTVSTDDDRHVPDDARLDEVSRQLLADLEEVKSLEQKKRRMTRSSPEFHQTAADVERAANHVWEHARLEEDIAREDSPIPDERESTEPGDWTRPTKE